MSAPGATPGPAAPRPKRKRRLAYVLSAALLGLVVALVLVEVAFRLLWTLPPWLAELQQAGMYTAAADGSPVLQPGYRGTLQIGADGPETRVAINALGMRGPELAAKQPGEQRVLMVGDSLVFGYGVEAEQALPACVERALRGRGVVATVGNGGVPGFGSRRYAEHLERLDAPFAADAFVFCSFLGNDAIDDTTPRQAIYAGLRLQGVMAQLVHTSWRTRLALRSRAALWLENWIFTNKPEWSPLFGVRLDPEDEARAVGLPAEGQRHAGLFLDARDERRAWQDGAPPVIPRLCGYLRESLERAKAIAAGRPLVYLVLPTVWQVDETERLAKLASWKWQPADYERGLAQRRWLAIARELGIPAFDATPILAAAGPAKELFIADGGHLSVRGNELVGAWLAGELAALLRR